MAADGYYSELVSYVVGPQGHVYLLNNTAYDNWSENRWKERIDDCRERRAPHRGCRAPGSQDTLTSMRSS